MGDREVVPMTLDVMYSAPELVELDQDERRVEHTFEVYIDDSRYSVPTLYLIAADEAGAIEAARRMVSDSSHHLGAELRLDGRRLIGFGSMAVEKDPQ
jgi:hypothetical protein